MRQLWITALAAVVVVGLGAGSAQAGKVEVKGVHLCCGQCVKGVAKILGGVDGVSDAACDQKTKTVTFTTKDGKATTAALKALTDGGFFGTASDDGKEAKIEVAMAKKGDKADTVTIKGVHICCGQCEKALAALYKNDKVECTRAGGEVKITGKGLDKAEVLDTLRKAGFNGTIDK